MLSITTQTAQLQELKVLVEGQECAAVGFLSLVGEAAPGDWVSLNTTAVALNLGTGGQHFVMAVARAQKDLSGTGHIMKVRYTPCQLQVLAAEEQDSPYHELLQEPCDLAQMPVAVATLHSLIAPFAVAFKRTAPEAKLAYVMTDGAALPLALSRLAHQLRQRGLLDAIITCGHAFGGDHEAVCVYSALQIAQSVSKAQACLLAMGPGVVGTGTPLGTTALEQAPILDGAAALGGRTLAVPRLSFADPRTRHYGLSHHTRTALGRLAQRSTTIVLPFLPEKEKETVLAQCRQSGLVPKHKLLWREAADVGSLLADAELKVTSMGRTPADDPFFFAAGAACGCAAADFVLKQS